MATKHSKRTPSKRNEDILALGSILKLMHILNLEKTKCNMYSIHIFKKSSPVDHFATGTWVQKLGVSSAPLSLAALWFTSAVQQSSASRWFPRPLLWPLSLYQLPTHACLPACTPSLTILPPSVHDHSWHQRWEEGDIAFTHHNHPNHSGCDYLSRIKFAVVEMVFYVSKTWNLNYFLLTNGIYLSNFFFFLQEV